MGMCSNLDGAHGNMLGEPASKGCMPYKSHFILEMLQVPRWRRDQRLLGGPDVEELWL